MEAKLIKIWNILKVWKRMDDHIDYRWSSFIILQREDDYKFRLEIFPGNGNIDVSFPRVFYFSENLYFIKL